MKYSKKRLIQENNKLFDYIQLHIDGKRTLRDEYNLIIDKKSDLPRKQREYLVKLAERWD